MSKFQRYLVNKLLWFILAFCALVLNFLLPRLIPGNPVDTIVAQMSAGGGVSGGARKTVQLLHRRVRAGSAAVEAIPDLSWQSLTAIWAHPLRNLRHGPAPRI